MAYTIRKSDGTVLATIADGTYDNSTSLTLPGKNLYNFGTLQNENFVYLLENFAKTTAPSLPVKGQLWFDTSGQGLKVYNGSAWEVLTLLTTNSANATSLGNLYFDTTNNQLSVYNGTSLSLIGPEGVSGFGTTRMVSTKLADLTNTYHPVIECYVNNEVVAIISSTAFSINSSNAVSGFPSVVRGITLKNGASNDATLFGNSYSSQNSYALRNAENTNFISASTSSNAGTIVQRDDSGTISASSVQTSAIYSTNGLLSGNWSVDSDLLPYSTLASNLGSSSYKWNNLYSQNVNAGISNAAVVNFNSQLVDPFSTVVSKFDTDATLASNRNDYLASQRAVKTYVDTAVSGVLTQVEGLAPSFGFIEPYTIFDLTGDGAPFLSGSQNLGANTTVLNVPWTTFNTISSAGLPANVKSVILEIHYTAHWIGDGNPSNNYNTAIVLGRNLSTTGLGTTYPNWPWKDCFLLARTATSEYKYWNQTVNMVQVTVPVRQTIEVNGSHTYPAGSFDYSIPARPYDGGGMEAVAIRLIGYYA
jgi:hypothetical protein